MLIGCKSSEETADKVVADAGGLAQLGERLAGSQKVSGSSPLSSTFCCACVLHQAAEVLYLIEFVTIMADFREKDEKIVAIAH